MLRRSLSMWGWSRISTIWWIRELLPSIALVQNCLPSSCEILRLRKKRVSVRLVHVDSLASSSPSLSFFYYFIIFCFYKCFPFVGMTTKFNQGMYARMRAKNNEPLSNLRARVVRVMEKGTSVTTATPSTPGIESGRIASLATLVEEIPPQQNKR